MSIEEVLYEETYRGIQMKVVLEGDKKVFFQLGRLSDSWVQMFGSIGNMTIEQAMKSHRESIDLAFHRYYRDHASRGVIMW